MMAILHSPTPAAKRNSKSGYTGLNGPYLNVNLQQYILSRGHEGYKPQDKLRGSAKKTVARPTSPKQKKKATADASPDGATQSRPRAAAGATQEHTYYIGGGNGNAIIEEVMNGLGWKRTKDKTDESVRLRWCEVKGGINYSSFKEGEQMVNRIPNGNLLTNKLGLLNSLQDHCRISNTIQKRPMSLDFLPETYRLDDPKDRETFTETFKENEIWICKPTGKNQGKGIFLVRSVDDLNNAISESDEANRQSQQQGKSQKPLNRIIQRYIMNPLLLDGRKFDIRCYMLFASTAPLLVFYHRGYCRLSMYEYDNSCENIIAHLTNQFIQKRDPQYAVVKEETAWTMDRFNEYINEKVAPVKGLEKDWVYGHLTKTIKQIMVQCVNAVKNKLQCRLGYFDMFGLDFMIDEDMKIWLIEVNVNPCLATNCEALRDRVPGVVRETLHLAIECFEKGRRNRPLLPLQALKDFELIYDGGAGKASTGGSPTRSTPQNGRGSAERNSSTQSPVRRARSLSPVKEVAPTRRPAATASTTAVPKATSTSSSDHSSPAGTKKSAKTPLASTAENESGELDASPGDAKKQSKRSKTSMANLKNGINSGDTENAEESVVERKVPSKTGSTAGKSGDVRSNKTTPNVAKPGVAKQSTSNTKEVQSLKKKISVENSNAAPDNSEDSSSNRGS